MALFLRWNEELIPTHLVPMRTSASACFFAAAGIRRTTLMLLTASSAPITVIDSIMGSGKTSWLMAQLNAYAADRLLLPEGDVARPPKARFLFITPNLEEVDRIQRECSALNFRDPQYIHGRKYFHLEKLIEEGANICTTHKLFSLLDQKVYRLLRERNYVLIIDEVIVCVDLFT